MSEPGTSDALVVLGPSWPHRTQTADGLMQQGAARALVVSAHPEDTLGELPLPCDQSQDRSYPVYCFDPSPATTQGEARMIAKLAAKHGWRDIQVLTYRPQISRAAVLIQRCYDGRLRMLESREEFNLGEQLVYQTGAFVKTALTPGC